MSTISIQTILEYYAIFCLAMSPLSVMLFVILYRKTNLVDRIDKLVDRILGIKEQPAQEKTQQKDGTESSANPAAETQELTGVACFSLKVDDVYYCRKNAQLFNGGYHEIQWSCDCIVNAKTSLDIYRAFEKRCGLGECLDNSEATDVTTNFNKK